VLERSASVVDNYIEFGNLDKIVTDRNSIVIGKLLARDLGIKETGKKVILVSPSGGIYTLKVVDFFNSGITSIDQSRVYMNLRTLQVILDKPNQVNELIIKVNDVDAAESLAQEMSNDTGYYTESWQRAFSNIIQIFKMQNWITYLMVFAILIVSSFGIFNIMMMTVLEKKRDIAILKASGFVLDRMSRYFVLGFIFAMIFAFFASYYPSLRASRLFPVDIFRSSV
jgi:lipoprotein-releasing system permease protein